MLVRVATIPALYGTSLAAAYTPDLIEAEINGAEDYLKTLVQSETLAGIKTETSALFGAVAQTILSVATSYNIDLIVMTSEGKTGMKRWVLGSITERVLDATRLPLLIVRPPETEFHRAGNGSAAFAAVERVALLCCFGIF